MKKILLLTSTLFLTACTGLLQSASLNEAYESYDRGEFEQTLELVTRAESIEQPHEALHAELTYLKAQAYEGLGRTGESRTLYEYLAIEHPHSQYGYLASRKLEALL